MFDRHLFLPFRRRSFSADFVPRTLAAQWDQNIFEGAFCNLLPGQCSGKKVDIYFRYIIFKREEARLSSLSQNQARMRV